MAGVQFDGFAMHMEVFSCSGPGPDGGAPTINPLTGLSGSGEGGSETAGEESGTALTLDQTYDTVRNGARLVMFYDAQNNAFAGAVVNTTTSTLQQVRVEVHLSNGVELGPTTPVDLAPGERVYVVLTAPDRAFNGWTPHAEAGAGGESGEHGPGGEGGSEGDGD